MNFKAHLLHNHLDYFPENSNDVSEEKGERFHLGLKRDEEKILGSVEYQNDG